jgi:hypothetical protein
MLVLAMEFSRCGAGLTGPAPGRQEVGPVGADMVDGVTAT